MTDPQPPSDRGERQEQEKWYERTRYQILLFVGGIALFGLVLGLILDWYIDPQTSTQKKDLVQALGLITAGVAGAVGILFTWRGQRITQQSLEDARKNTEENLRLTEQGQITERFTRAIDQLGATDDDGTPRLEVRLGGIYALERIDKESPERDYHSTVMEVLTAYVRENAPWPPKPSKSSVEGFIEPPGEGSIPDTASDEGAEQEKGTEHDTELTRRPPSGDIQSILDVLSRREAERVPEKHRVDRLELWRTDLRGAYLLEAHLEGANLVGAHLEGARLSPEQLECTVGSESTELPEGFVLPELWTKSTDEQEIIIEQRLKQEPKHE